MPSQDLSKRTNAYSLLTSLLCAAWETPPASWPVKAYLRSRTSQDLGQNCFVLKCSFSNCHLCSLTGLNIPAKMQGGKFANGGILTPCLLYIQGTCLFAGGNNATEAELCLAAFIIQSAAWYSRRDPDVQSEAALLWYPQDLASNGLEHLYPTLWRC